MKKKKNSRNYEKKGLPNSEILWKQYQSAIMKSFESDKKTQKVNTDNKLKNLKRISRVQIANRFTKQTAYKALPNDKTDFSQTHVWDSDSEEFLALLGTPNCNGAIHLLSDHVDQLDGKNISNITLNGHTNDLNIDINFTV